MVNRKSKKIIAYCLLSILLINMSAYTIMERCMFYSVKSHVWSQINSNTLHTSDFQYISISPNDVNQKENGFSWKEKNKEFFYNNDLYDVVSKTEHNGIITYKCYNDTQELALEKRVDQLAKDIMDGGLAKNKTENLFQKISKDYRITSAHQRYIQPIILLGNKQYMSCTTSQFPPYIISPPPEA